MEQGYRTFRHVDQTSSRGASRPSRPKPSHRQTSLFPLAQAKKDEQSLIRASITMEQSNSRLNRAINVIIPDGYCTSITVADDEMCGVEVSQSGSGDSAYVVTDADAMYQAIESSPIFEVLKNNGMWQEDVILSLISSSASDEENAESLHEGNTDSDGIVTSESAESDSSEVRKRVEKLLEDFENKKLGDFQHDNAWKGRTKGIRQPRCPEGPRSPRQTKVAESKGLILSSGNASNVDKMRKQVRFNLPAPVINLLDTVPDNTLANLMARSHPVLQQVLIDAADVSFLFTHTPGQTDASKAYKETMIEEIFGVKCIDPPPAADCKTRSDTAGPGNLSSQEQDEVETIQVKETYTPPSQPIMNVINVEPIQLEETNTPQSKTAVDLLNLETIQVEEPNVLSAEAVANPIQAEDAKRILSERYEAGLEEPVESLDFQYSLSDDNTLGNFVLAGYKVAHPDADNSPRTPSIPGQVTDLTDLVTDEELKEFLKRTKGGDEASTVFPTASFRNEEATSVIFSDDGLGDELIALDNIVDQVQKELAFADCVINKSGSGDSERSLKKRLWMKKTVQRRTSAPREYEGDTDTTVSVTDSEESQETAGSQQQKNRVKSSSKKTSIGEITGIIQRRGNTPEKHSSEGNKGQRRVRFSEENEERLYVVPSVDEDPAANKSSNPRAWLGPTLEEAYIAFEDMMDDLSLSCSGFVESHRKVPSLKKPVKASNAHYI